MPTDDPPRYLGRRHSLTEVGDHVELRDRLWPEPAPVRYPSTATGWRAAIAELRRLDGSVLDASSGKPVGASPGGPRRRRLWVAFAFLALVAIILGTVLPLLLGGADEPTGGPRTAPPQLTESEVVDRVRRGTMLVVSYDGEPIAVGSGWMYDAAQALVVTNAHVLETGTSFRAGLPGSLANASLVAEAPCADLAILRLSAVIDFRTVELASDEGADPGDRVVAMGYPPGLPTIPEATQVRSSFGAITPPPTGELSVFVQHTARLDPGNSGGPLVDMRGHLVGMNVGVDRSDARYGYAIPVAALRELIRDMLAGVDVCMG
jgi:S1-C subfamily serine protease